MRYILTRIFKNIPVLDKFWFSYLEYLDFKYYKKYCNNYIIVPFGCYCLPRLITVINRFKPTKKYGEKSYPFDLCISDFDSNLLLLSSHFKNFFDNIIFDDCNSEWHNDEYKLRFIHDGSLSREQFMERYSNRILNLYNALNNKHKHLYFIIATSEFITSEKMNLFIREIMKYREMQTFSIIVINQSNKNYTFNHDNVYCIDLYGDKYFAKTTDWFGTLKKMKTFRARIFNYKIKSKLSKIIKKDIC